MPPVILWIDGAGGYLLLRDEAVSLGPAFVDPPSDVALLADLPTDRATIRRDTDGYWLEAEGTVAVNQTRTLKSHLASGDRITLGTSCQLAFFRPEPLSASARLTILSGHRFVQPVDAVLLMADALVLDRKQTAHVPTLDVESRVVIARSGGDLALIGKSAIRVDGKAVGARHVLVAGQPASVDGLTLTLEAIG